MPLIATTAMVHGRALLTRRRRLAQQVTFTRARVRWPYLTCRSVRRMQTRQAHRRCGVRRAGGKASSGREHRLELKLLSGTEAHLQTALACLERERFEDADHSNDGTCDRTPKTSSSFCIAMLLTAGLLLRLTCCRCRCICALLRLPLLQLLRNLLLHFGCVCCPTSIGLGLRGSGCMLPMRAHQCLRTAIEASRCTAHAAHA